MNKLIATMLVASFISSCGDAGFGYKPLKPGHDDASANDVSGVQTDDGEDTTPSGSSDQDQDQGGGQDAAEETDTLLSCRPGELRINEVFYDVVGSDTNGDEFIELKGSAGACVGGYKLLLTNGDDGAIYKEMVLPESAIIPSDGIYVIADVDPSGSTRITDPDHLLDFDPQNGPDAVELVGADGEMIDGVCYGNVPVKNTKTGLEICFFIAPDVASGQSIERDTATGEFKANTTPTPGVSN